MRRCTGFPLIFISYTVIFHMKKEVYRRRGHSHEGPQQEAGQAPEEPVGRVDFHGTGACPPDSSMCRQYRRGSSRGGALARKYTGQDCLMPGDHG
jgi:hypothetical protein